MLIHATDNRSLRRRRMDRQAARAWRHALTNPATRIATAVFALLAVAAYLEAAHEGQPLRIGFLTAALFADLLVVTLRGRSALLTALRVASNASPWAPAAYRWRSVLRGDAVLWLSMVWALLVIDGVGLAWANGAERPAAAAMRIALVSVGSWLLLRHVLLAGSRPVTRASR